MPYLDLANFKASAASGEIVYSTQYLKASVKDPVDNFLVITINKRKIHVNKNRYFYPVDGKSWRISCLPCRAWNQAFYLNLLPGWLLADPVKQDIITCQKNP